MKKRSATQLNQFLASVDSLHLEKVGSDQVSHLPKSWERRFPSFPPTLELLEVASLYDEQSLPTENGKRRSPISFTFKKRIKGLSTKNTQDTEESSNYILLTVYSTTILHLSACLRSVKSDRSSMLLVLKVWIPVMDMMPVSEQLKYHQRLCQLADGSKHPLQPSHCRVECQVVRFPFVLWGYVKLLVHLMNEMLLGVGIQVKGSSQEESQCSVWFPDTVASKKLNAYRHQY